MILKVKVWPVGAEKDKPTRFDISVEGVNGAICGHAFTESQAKVWAEGIQWALNEQHKKSFEAGILAERKKIVK